ncbi:MAG TPA: type II secretion system F family protein [archaeon]|jgi:archaellum biogenesis protein FlaJ (TadC family)|nr:type II secretion system F family protein [archaeon]HPC10216.1 type II secretion system F family protein [archaeon]HRT02463.1 type II secretion system F family protein [Candidatus Diapherotrites archaeon]
MKDTTQNKLLNKYQIYLSSIKIKIPALYWILIFLIFSLILGLLVYLVSNTVMIGILVFIIILDLGIGVPIFVYRQTINKIEKNWPDALKLIADSMKAGSSFDFSLREVASADFGPLSLQITEMVRRLEMGYTMQDALSYLSDTIDSKTIRRTITIIKEALISGAQLAETLEDIADDAKNMFRIKKERQTKTMMQVIFIAATGAVVAPFIFGITHVLTEFLTNVASSAGVVTGEIISTSIEAQKVIFMLLDIYLIVLTFAAAAMICIMRDGNLTGIFIYFPVMLGVSYAIYSLSQTLISGLLLGIV